MTDGYRYPVCVEKAGTQVSLRKMIHFLPRICQHFRQENATMFSRKITIFTRKSSFRRKSNNFNQENDNFLQEKIVILTRKSPWKKYHLFHINKIF